MNSAVATFAAALGGLMVFSYVLVAVSEGMLVPKATLYADFRDSAGIGRQTEVQLAGRLIGKVVDIGFTTEHYSCNPKTEDYGHPGQGRTDDCEPWMFCAPTGDDPSAGSCAELEVYSGHASDYQGCDGRTDSCEAGQICVTRAFRQRYRDVRWWGQAGWCVNYDSDSQRIRVAMEVNESALQYIQDDSRASIVLNGLLADPRVNISVGTSGTVVESGARLQTTTSMTEELLGLKDQIDKLADDIDRGLIGLSALTEVLEDEATKADVNALKANVGALRKQLAAAEGLVGAVLNDPNTRSDLSQTMRELRSAASEVEDDYEVLVRKTKRAVRAIKRAANQLEALQTSLADPDNTSLVAMLMREDSKLQDQVAALGDEAQESIGAARVAYADIGAALDEIGRALERREGTLGRLIADPKPVYHLKDPAALRRVNVVKGLVRWVIADSEDKGELEPTIAERDDELEDEAEALGLPGTDEEPLDEPPASPSP